VAESRPAMPHVLDRLKAELGAKDSCLNDDCIDYGAILGEPI
jgi:hypothetical protein